MTAIETLERAISKLEALRDEATPGEWWATRDLKWPSIFAGTGLNDDVMVASECRLPGDATLIVALSRAVEPLLQMHRRSLASMKRAIGSGMSETDVETIAEMSGEVALARAILGEEAEGE